MDLTETLIWYYKGERNEALWLAGFGMFLMIMNALVWKNMHANDLLRGMLYPLLFLGLLGIFAGGFNAWNNQKRLAELPRIYAQDTQSFKLMETECFEGAGGVNSWWLPLKITWSVLLLIGIGFGFLSKSDWWHGFAIGLLLWGTFGWVVDGFAHQRAKIYTTELLQP
ncbi:hypothetical protein [Pararhodonellum marinum]|uniref:hypothetical protein n=1 Tax=Pararhodonellum marinum TaxID=2755358 RepID=UPI00188F4EC5|nr:hypothetical protein [Pararhodonellum marinum]